VILILSLMKNKKVNEYIELLKCRRWYFFTMFSSLFITYMIYVLLHFMSFSMLVDIMLISFLLH
jgi:hypothetical protein